MQTITDPTPSATATFAALERAWNAPTVGLRAPFATKPTFVNVRGEHHVAA
jgi:hypothetical protein